MNKSTEGGGNIYNKKLIRLKQSLSDVPYSYIFLKYLKYIEHNDKSLPWKRGDSIDKTPLTHNLHADYIRVEQKTCFLKRDKNRGKPRPDFFIRDHNILYNTSNVIGDIDKIYTMIRPFNYDFPDFIIDKGMEFKLYEIYNPLYICERNGEGPEPILINGIMTPPISNKMYTKIYKDYIKKSQECNNHNRQENNGGGI